MRLRDDLLSQILKNMVLYESRGLLPQLMFWGEHMDSAKLNLYGVFPR